MTDRKTENINNVISPKLSVRILKKNTANYYHYLVIWMFNDSKVEYEKTFFLLLIVNREAVK